MFTRPVVRAVPGIAGIDVTAATVASFKTLQNWTCIGTVHWMGIPAAESRCAGFQIRRAVGKSCSLGNGAEPGRPGGLRNGRQECPRYSSMGVSRVGRIVISEVEDQNSPVELRTNEGPARDRQYGRKAVSTANEDNH